MGWVTRVFYTHFHEDPLDFAFPTGVTHANAGIEKSILHASLGRVYASLLQNVPGGVPANAAGTEGENE
jgi:hypothetical protein